jgi:hypothetical protein
LLLRRLKRRLSNGTESAVRCASVSATQIAQGQTVPLDRLLEARGIGSEDSERLKQAFNLALNGLHLVDRNDPICAIVARKIIEIGLDGTHEPQEIAALTIKQLGP